MKKWKNEQVIKNEKLKKNRLQSCIKMIICGFTKKKEK